MLKILIKIHEPDLKIPQEIAEGDCIDLRCGKEVFIPKFEYREISLGVSMKLPDGYSARLYPRSSLFKKLGIILTTGTSIIDESYCGNNDIWRFPAFCLVPTMIQNGTPGTLVPFNKRIAQFELVRKMEPVKFVVVNDLFSKDRGGIGSTDDD